MLTTGQILQERYEIRGLLGKGGYGAVYEAFHIKLQRLCAIKELRHRGDPEFVNSFEREAQLLAGLSHPALPKVSDFFLEGDGFYFVMDYIPGEDLGAYVARQPDGMIKDETEVLRLIEPILNALEFLHQRQPAIIHRDIKRVSNIPIDVRATLRKCSFSAL